MERPSFLSPTAPGARKNVRARLAARKENVTPPDAVAAALKADRSPPAPGAKSLPPLAVAAGVVAAAYVARALFARE